MKDRIRKLRKALDLTQKEFAERIGMKSNTIATYEMGRAFPSDPTINNICKEFNASEAWLRTGEGEMFVPAPTSELDALAARYPQMTHETYVFIEKLVNLPESSQNILMGFIREVVESFDDVPAETRARPGSLDIDAEVASYRAELELQEKVEDGLSASDGVSATG